MSATNNVYMEFSTNPHVVVGNLATLHGVTFVVTAVTPYQDGPRDPSMWVVTGISATAESVYITLKGQ